LCTIIIEQGTQSSFVGSRQYEVKPVSEVISTFAVSVNHKCCHLVGQGEFVGDNIVGGTCAMGKPVPVTTVPVLAS
jgi:hypothetical protein